MSTMIGTETTVRGKANKTKRNKIIYWIATVWLSLGMLSAAIVQLIKMDAEVDMMTHLGYPSYLLIILGATKILG